MKKPIFVEKIKKGKPASQKVELTPEEIKQSAKSSAKALIQGRNSGKTVFIEVE